MSTCHIKLFSLYSVKKRDCIHYETSLLYLHRVLDNVLKWFRHNHIIKGDMSVYLFVCMLPMAGLTVGPIKTKLGIGTYVDPGSVLVKVKVIWRHLVNANKTPYRGPQGPRE